jgi:hypothetical protein
VQAHPGGAVLAQSSPSGPLGMYGPRLQGLALFREGLCNDPKIVTIFHKHLEHKMHLKIPKIKKSCMLLVNLPSIMYILFSN